MESYGDRQCTAVACGEVPLGKRQLLKCVIEFRERGLGDCVCWIRCDGGIYSAQRDCLRFLTTDNTRR